MAKTPTFINSGNILFDTSPNGVGPQLSPSRPTWLNQKILDIDKAITDLEASGVKPGKDGKQVELTAGYFPNNSDPNKKPAILWRLKQDVGQPELPWQLLIYTEDITGPQGAPGPVGPQGLPGSDGLQGPQGPKGDQGIAGVQGPQGVKGDPGAQGPKGDIGPKGDPGLDGGQGAPGPVGPIGPQGPSGAQGPAGPQGPRGDKGDKGEDGQAGPAGTKGDKGEKGDKGDDGQRGEKGDKGDDGTSIKFHGTVNTKNELTNFRSSIGDGVYVKDSGHLWILQSNPYTSLDNWGDMGRIEGPKGDRGDVGPRGPSGAPGAQGPAGAQGPQGPRGDKGDSGSEGHKGDKGEKGDPGATGATGPKGETGAQGPRGPQGAQGPVGPHGAAGSAGATGPRGPAGPQGSAGAKGDTGATGPRGWTGPQGPRGWTGPAGPSGGGGIGQFLLQWIVDSATSAAISAAVSTVSSELASAIDTLTNQLASLAESTAENVVQEALDKAWDELKGDKGEKGDKGDKGDDGKSVQLVGKFKNKTAFFAKYPLYESNVGKAGLCGDDPTQPKELWAILQDSSGAFPYPPNYVNLGDIRGPKGEDARWEVSIRDTAFTEKTKIVVDSDVDPSVASMYIRDTDSIVVEGLSGSQIQPNQVGFKIAMRYPISRPAKKDDPAGKPSTVGKVLSNDGEKLIWIDPPAGQKPTKDQILLKAPDGTVWAITVSDQGRLYQNISTDPTEDTGVDLKSPNGGHYRLHVSNDGQLHVTKIDGFRIPGTP